MHDESLRLPSPMNSFTELYRMSTQAMTKKKEEMVIEESNSNDPKLNEVIDSKSKKKNLSKKRKNKGKESTEEFIFLKKTARPVSSTSTQDPIETSNHFSDLEQDVEQPLPTDSQITIQEVNPKTMLHPVMFKIKKNFREQIKFIYKNFPNIRNRTAGDGIKIFTNNFEEYLTLIHTLETDKEFEFYVINRKLDKPIKALIKGLPSSSKIEDIKNDLVEEGYFI
ncbi:uncharacterized protein TNCV_3883931 [Trichonephila clavipes]|nr:uncharacterized protein TNCV_3883931 [Trichonephila clavipes]